MAKNNNDWRILRDIAKYDAAFFTNMNIATQKLCCNAID